MRAFGAIVLTGVGLAVGIAIVLMLVYGIFQYLAASSDRHCACEPDGGDWSSAVPARAAD